MYELDEPKLGMNPTNWASRDRSTKPKNITWPTNLVFKENPGGEYRKSYHGYPHGYAQLLHSPEHFICEPMQIDTHNREYAATDPVGYKPTFLPKSIDGRDGTVSGENLHSGAFHAKLRRTTTDERFTQQIDGAERAARGCNVQAYRR